MQTVQISSELYVRLKASAVQLGLTVDAFTNDLISQALLSGLDNFSFEYEHSFKGLKGRSFTDEGARAYSQAARYEFQKQASIKGLGYQDALDQLAQMASKYEGDIDLIKRVLIGKYVLSGDDMRLAIQLTGECPMQKTLQEWSGDPLPFLCKAFVDAIEL